MSFFKQFTWKRLSFFQRLAWTLSRSSDHSFCLTAKFWLILSTPSFSLKSTSSLTLQCSVLLSEHCRKHWFIFCVSQIGIHSGQSAINSTVLLVQYCTVGTIPSYHANTVVPTLESNCFVVLCDDFQQMASHFQMIASEKWKVVSRKMIRNDQVPRCEINF